MQRKGWQTCKTVKAAQRPGCRLSPKQHPSPGQRRSPQLIAISMHLHQERIEAAGRYVELTASGSNMQCCRCSAQMRWPSCNPCFCKEAPGEAL